MSGAALKRLEWCGRHDNYRSVNTRPRGLGVLHRLRHLETTCRGEVNLYSLLSLAAGITSLSLTIRDGSRYDFKRTLDALSDIAPRLRSLELRISGEWNELYSLSTTRGSSLSRSAGGRSRDGSSRFACTLCIALPVFTSRVRVACHESAIRSVYRSIGRAVDGHLKPPHPRQIGRQ